MTPDPSLNTASFDSPGAIAAALNKGGLKCTDLKMIDTDDFDPAALQSAYCVTRDASELNLSVYDNHGLAASAPMRLHSLPAQGSYSEDAIVGSNWMIDVASENAAWLDRVLAIVGGERIHIPADS